MSLISFLKNGRVNEITQQPWQIKNCLLRSGNEQNEEAASMNRKKTSDSFRHSPVSHDFDSRPSVDLFLAFENTPLDGVEDLSMLLSERCCY